jgi:hypothetical protein
MSSRRRRAAEPAPEEEHQEEERDNEGLKFNQQLSWRAGKPIPTAELHKRLDTLAKELAELDQDWDHKDSLTKVAKELCSANILGHKDKGVKAYAACCMVDILKICAPDAPFTPSQLKVSSSIRRDDVGDGIADTSGRTSSPSLSTRFYLPYKTRPLLGITNTDTFSYP